MRIFCRSRLRNAKGKILMALVAGTMMIPANVVLTHAAEAESVDHTNVMPTIRSYQKDNSGTFTIKNDSRIYFVDTKKPEGHLADTLKLVASESAAKKVGPSDVMDIVYGSNTGTRSGDIIIKIGDLEKTGADADQAYKMEVTTDNVTITAKSPTGIKYAMNTLIQKSGTLETGTIEDYPDVKERSLYVDCGRKFFEVASLKAMIKDLSWNKMNVLYLDFANNEGFRFQLDDMTMSWTNNSNRSISGIVGSAQTSYGTGYLTEKDMNEIIELADLYGVKVIPSLNSPGHMGKILTAFTSYRKSGSTSTVNLDNAEAYSFAKSIVEKYARYFKSKGIDTFNVACDEADGYTTKASTKFVDYIKDLNTMLLDLGYKDIRMFNDGIKTGDANMIPSNMTVLYWDPGFDSKASVLEILQNGNDVVNFASDYLYYAAGNGRPWGFECSAQNIFDGTWISEVHSSTQDSQNHNSGWNPGKFSKVWAKQQMSFIDGEFTYPTYKDSIKGKLIGASYELWIDHPGSTYTDQNVVSTTWAKMRTMAERAWRVNTDSIRDPMNTITVGTQNTTTFSDAQGHDVNQPKDITYSVFEQNQLKVSTAPGGFNSNGTIDTTNNTLPQSRDIIPAEVDKTALIEMIKTAEAKIEEEYTPNSWAALQSVLKAAEGVRDNTTANEAAVQEATENLEKAIQALVERANKGELEALIEEAEALTEDRYTPNSWDGLEDLIEEAKGVAKDDNALQSEVDDMVKQLGEKLESLVFVSDKAELEALIDQANNVDKALYTEDSYNAMKDVVNEAEAVAKDLNASEEEVKAMVEQLQAAIDALKADKTELQKATEEAKEVDKDVYTEETVAELEEAVKNAEAVIADDNATVQQVQSAVEALEKAVKGLKLDKSELDKVIKDAEAVDTSKYTDESLAAFNEALEEARKVYTDEDATIEQIKNAAEDLNKAIAGLTEKPVEKPVEEPDNTEPTPDTPKDDTESSVLGDEESNKQEDIWQAELGNGTSNSGGNGTTVANKTETSKGTPTGDETNMSMYVGTSVAALGIMYLTLKKRKEALNNK